MDGGRGWKWPFYQAFGWDYLGLISGHFFAFPALLDGLRHFCVIFPGSVFLLTQLGFESGKLGFDILLRLALANDLFAIAAQEVVDGFDTDANGAGGLVLVEILKAEIRRAGLFDDALDNPVDGGIVAALETGHFERD